MEKLNRHIPFRGGQKMHVSALKVFIHLCSPHGSFVINMNSSTSMSSWLLFGSLNHSLCYLMIKILLSMITLHGIAFEPINMLATIFLCFNQTMMFMKRLSNLFWISLNLMWNLAFLFDLPQIHHLKREYGSISIVSKLALIIFACLFHNYFAYDFHVDVLCFMHRYLT
jgi:hypothetical protein